MANLMLKLKKISKTVITMVAIAFLSLGMLGLSPVSANAQGKNFDQLPKSNEICGQGGGRGRLVSCKDDQSLGALAGNIAGIFTFIVASIAIIFIVYGAFVWMTDMEKGAEKGRKIITNSVIALIISVIAYGIVATLIGFLNTSTVSTTFTDIIQNF